MDFILKSKEFGKKGQLKNTENKEVTTSTLQGVLEVPFKEPSQLNINNKLLIINNKELNIKEKKIPSLFEFMEYYKTELSLIFPNLDFQVETKYEAWVENKWKDGNNNQIKNWKTKLKSTLPYLKPQTNGKSNNTAQGREDALRDWGRMASSTSNNEGN